MRKNVILSTVAATVVTGVLMMSGCGSSSSPEQADQGYTGIETVDVAIVDGKVDSVVTVEGTPTAVSQASTVKTTVSVRGISDCVDANQQPAPCVEVCTPASPCSVTVEAKCPSNLNYANDTDAIGAWHAYNNTGNADVVAERNDDSTYPTFSGVAIISQAGGIGACGFDFSTFIVCAVTKDGDHYWNTSTNSAGYVMVLVEYADGSSEWVKVDVTRKSNGVEDDQPFIELTGLNGKVPAKLTVFSILKTGAPATGSTGSTGTTGAGD